MPVNAFGASYIDPDDMPELDEAIRSGILFRWLAPEGGMSARVEEEVRTKMGVGHALALPNCTLALRLALIATQPRIGDRVYIPAVTFVATAGAVLSAGLIPVLVDVDDSLSLDPALLPAGAERVIVAHIEGTVGQVPEDVPFVVEDAAQAMGAYHPDGRYIGTAGYAGAFSFNHNKLLSSGEGGLVVTNDGDRWQLMMRYHDHGSSRVQGQYPTWDPGTFYGENLVTNEATSAIQLQQLRHHDEVVAGIARHYDITLDALPSRPDINVLHRSKGDVKWSVRLELESAELRERALSALRGHDIPVWTLDRYYLPEHPVLAGRCSIYADGFPWNLAPAGPLGHSRDGFRNTKSRLQRILCLRLSPKLADKEQAVAAEKASAVLKAL
jgi:8-amino-3,8-dideoxy-alpha-D-manno-octulosonate transaminase